jgi:hypothetical protein
MSRECSRCHQFEHAYHHPDHRHRDGDCADQRKGRGHLRYSFGASKLSSDEARRIGQAIARIPEFLMARQGFYPRGGGPRWRADRPYHVALEDRYIREHWYEIDALCKLNSLPFNATGEVIENGGVWRVYEFTWQMDAILFWARFEGRWLRGTEFHYPEHPENLPSLKPLTNWPKFNPRNLR